MGMEKHLIDLIQKYDCQGPRYTSYPPAPVFSSAFGADDYQEAVIQTEADVANPDLSLYFHFPFCDTLCYFCGCTTIITQSQNRIQEYIGYLKKEIDLLSRMLNPNRKIVQLHWGGGTPTSLSPTQIYDIGSYINRSFCIDDKAEIGVEVDPRNLTYEHLTTLRQVGFNRISVGVQDFDRRVQDAVNRQQSEFITRQVIDWSRNLGFSSLNVDLIYGLPLQTAKSFSATLDKIIDISPDRIAVYNFAYVPWMKKHQKLIHREDLPPPDVKIQLLAMTIEKLTGAGYIYIGMDHFAKPDDELAIAQKEKTLHRNFQGYSTRAGSDLYGFGMSAISHFAKYYAQNEKELQEYYKAIAAGTFATRVGYRMTFDDEVRKYLIMKFMCDLGLRKKDVECKFGMDFDSYFAESTQKLIPMIEDGLVIADQESFHITTTGRLFLRNIAMCFDAYLKDALKEQPIFSRTV